MEAQGKLVGGFLPWAVENFWVQSLEDLDTIELSIKEEWLQLEANRVIVTKMEKPSSFSKVKIAEL